MKQPRITAGVYEGKSVLESHGVKYWVRCIQWDYCDLRVPFATLCVPKLRLKGSDYEEISNGILLSCNFRVALM